MRSSRSAPASQVLPARRGFSLIEVIIATAILLGSAVVLSRLAGLGRTYAQNTTNLAQAQRICENTLNEIMIEVRPLFPIESAPLMPIEPEVGRDENRSEILRPGQPQDQLVSADNIPRWLHSVRIQPEQRTPGLVRLTVEVVQARRTGQGKIHYSLTRWIRREPERNPIDDFSDSDVQSFGSIN